MQYEEYRRLLLDLCGIPAPSHHEEKRAEFIKKWLEEHGCSGVYIDEAKNVVYPVGCEGDDEITVIMAHTDTVFPDTEPMQMRFEGDRLYCPGVGDDTANVVTMLAAAVAASRIEGRGGILFVANSCEEGLGNLKGCRQIMKDYAGRIGRVISFDCGIHEIVCDAVGSHRYRITLKTEGGHSFSKFGSPNAIARMAEVISRLYSLEVPHIGSSRTTYNVGVIEGGTSVNTIAQKANILYEYRSDNAECLEIMRDKFNSVISEFTEIGYDISVETLGIRPCAEGVDAEKEEALISTCAEIMRKNFGISPTKECASTDCNIPLSMGIPAVSFGTVETYGAHTREEYAIMSSLDAGIDTSVEIMCKFYKK